MSEPRIPPPPPHGASVRTQAILDAYEQLALKDRAFFTLDGYTVQILEPPVETLNPEGLLVGLLIRARAQDAEGVTLPESDGLHQVINPPLQYWNGQVDGDGNPIMIQNPVRAFQGWLVESLLYEARRLGYTG